MVFTNDFKPGEEGAKVWSAGVPTSPSQHVSTLELN
jgi:hypothetical protein